MNAIYYYLLRCSFVDNGFLYLKDHRIPRENLLMKYCSVEKDGSFKLAGKKAIKLGYGSMLNLRVILVPAFMQNALNSTTLAYNHREAARKYYEQVNNVKQRYVGIRDIQLKEDFSIITSTLLSCQRLREIYQLYQQAILNDDPSVLSILAEIHILSAGQSLRCLDLTLNITLKWNLNWSTQPERLAQSVPSPTYEGDNHVLLQQTGKYLLKLIMIIKQQQDEQNENKSNKRFNSELQFLKECSQNKNSVDILHNLNFNNFESVQKALEMTLYLYIEDVAIGIYKQMQQGDKQIHQILHETNQYKIVNYSKFFIKVMNIRFSKQYFNSNKFEEKSKQTIQYLLHLNLLNVVEEYKNLMFVYHMSDASKQSNIDSIRNQLYEKINDSFLVNSYDNPVLNSFNSSTFDEFQQESLSIEKSLKGVFSELVQTQKSNVSPKL